MPETASIAKVCLPVLLVSSVATAGLGLIAIWSDDPSETVGRLLVSAFLIMLASGFVLSSTRGIESGRRPRDG